MKNTLLASLMLAAAALPAQADVLVCGLKDQKGLLFSYLFAESEPGTLIELKFGKGKDVLVHQPDQRPVWQADTSDGFLWLTYMPDPRFAIRMSVDSKRADLVEVGDDGLVGRAILRGSCGITKEGAPQ